MGRCAGSEARLDDELGRVQSHGTGANQQFRSEQAQFRPPHRGVNQIYEPAALVIRQSRMRGQRERQEWA
ncbi:hypothetical protein N792_01970 [Lysobacter concretionis Ko07 = DSM 16239]|uniref:Uncharacterized protein n=1 Tax=Lysobacter concretionis Ko07 = DSM 16239 TaxID=1122185 RepID=A0A0A0EV31_9GAMM|nr:hypothetical protein N792_01970 [Lysobacter concretionis Ko07 = DSM 16239]